jgi:N-acetylglucosamine-6-sulfatase
MDVALRRRGTAILLVLLAALLAVAAVVALRDADGQSTRPPNVVVIMTDDQTPDSVAAMPHVQQDLATQGTTFANSFVSYPLCCPSRATWLTGKYAHNHHVLGNHPPGGSVKALHANETLPVWLQRAGYHTIHIGKYLNGYGEITPGTEIPPGWNEWYASKDPSTYSMYGYTLNENGTLKTYGNDPASYQTDVYRDKAVDAIRRNAGAPFYLALAVSPPHAETGQAGRAAGAATVRTAQRYQSAEAGAVLPQPPSFNEADMSDKPSFMRGLTSIQPKGVEAITQEYRGRLASLLPVDDAVDAVVQTLSQTGQLDNTLIIFTSDNGFFAGEHRIRSGKLLPYEPSIRVPLILRGPHVKAGAIANEPAVNPDLAATILDETGAKPGRSIDGRSLLPFAAHPSERTRRPILLETTQTTTNGDLDQDNLGSGNTLDGGGGQIPRYRGMRTSRYKYIEYGNGDRELYDLRRDPYELSNRAGDIRYRRTQLELAHDLRGLRRCRGSTCRRQIEPVPPPAR